MPSHNPQFMVGSGAAGAAQSLAAATDIHIFPITCKCRLLSAGFNLVAAVSSSGNTVVEFDRTPYNEGSRESACVQLTIPATATTGGNVYWDAPSTAKYLYQGDIVTVQVATAATSSGTGYPYLELEYIPEVAGNNAYMHEV